MSTNKERGEQALDQLDKSLKSRDRKEKSGPLKTVIAAAGAIVVVVGGIWFAATQTGEEEIIAEETSTEQTTETPEMQLLAMSRAEALPETVSCTYEPSGEAPEGVSAPGETENVSTTGTVTVNLDTNQGPIGMELDRTVAPCTVNAMEHLAATDYFDDTVCHRLTTSGIFVLQCGDPTGTGTGGPGFQFANEYPTDEATDTASPVIYPRGSIAMANSGPDTNGSQFFLNYQDSPLPPQYTYFGQISEEGLATLDTIAETGVEGGAADGAPAEEIRIIEASVA
ncbi:peptidylprolyl isomerase [Corynebacterium sp. A21]|uniref:peptidylprolyl isomerase n=1 Tax=Corynebacterium sp. A21 TaxID=3457318 RepID=UPI003FD5BE94